jgi:hypothetical protein
VQWYFAASAVASVAATPTAGAESSAHAAAAIAKDSAFILRVLFMFKLRIESCWERIDSDRLGGCPRDYSNRTA